jgi:peptide/nickel transport system ATP-binding protein
MKIDTILNISNVEFGYTKAQLIYKDFSLTLKRGEVICVVGGSGSGKSTLFELITSALTPSRGTIEVQRVATIYQDPYSSFHPTYSIIEQINDVVKSYEKSELDSLLDALKLEKDLIEKKPHELSGGQLQRCSILRAVLMKPDVILADEPTSALDNIIALETMKILLSFLDKVGILLITHDHGLARWCADTVIDIEKLKGRNI